MAIFRPGVAQEAPGLRSPTTNFNGSNGINGTGQIQDAYRSSVLTQAGDYDRIMKGFGDLASSSSPTTFSRNDLTPQFMNFQRGVYQESPDFEDAIGKLKGFSENGGFSESDIANLRARSVSPIRSAYATALKELNRQKALSGGYAPNQGAVLAKFAREKSGLMADKYTDINAALADKVASNKLASLQSLAPLTAQEQQARNAFNASEVSRSQGVEQYNTGLVNDFNRYNSDENFNVAKLNAEENNRSIANKQNALSGMASIYGTSPGLVNTFGSQALADRNQIIANNGQRANTGLQLISQAYKPGFAGVRLPG